MALANYDDLKSAVASWAARSDLSAVIPDTITLAEAMMNYGDGGVEPIRVPDQETTATTTPSSGAITLASDFLSMKRVTYTSDPRRLLAYASPEWLDEAYPSGESADPQFYTIIGSSLKTYPLGSSDIEYVYWAKIPALSDANTTNWLLTRMPQVYLFGSLFQLATYLKDAEEAAAFLGLYRSAVDGLVRSYHMNKAGSYAIRASAPAW